jgi:hypothetical protein
VRCKSTEDLKESMILYEKKKIERVLFVFTGKALWFGLISRITLAVFLISILTCTLDSVPYTREKPLLIRRCCSCCFMLLVRVNPSSSKLLHCHAVHSLVRLKYFFKFLFFYFKLIYF